MPATDKTERMSAAAFQSLASGSKGRRATLPPHTPQEPPVYEAPTQNVPGRRFTFSYSGPVVSNNATYAGMHWSKRKATTDKWHGIFGKLLVAAGVQPMQRFTLSLRYNSRHDVDNLSLLTKLAVDAMKGVYIPDDTKKHYRGLCLTADESLPHNTFLFTLTELL